MIQKSLRRIRVGLAVTMCAAAVAQTAYAQDMNAAIDKAVQKYETVKTARGTLQQTNVTAIGNTHNLSGPFQQQLPNLMSVRYTEPKGEVFVADGTWVYSYSPSSNPGVATRFRLSGVGAGVNLIGLFLATPHTKYSLADSGRKTIDGRVTRMVGLVPKQPMPEFRTAKVWIEESTGIIWQFETTQSSGAVLKVRFVTLELNAPVDASQFKFTAPRGVRIVDR